jgi:uncharacterized protein
MTAAFRDRLRLGCAVTSIERTPHGVIVHDSHGRSDSYDHVVIAARCAVERSIDLTGGRVLLLCYPRLLGYTFNPLSVYFCYRADGGLALLIYEVRNTFGDIHSYALVVKPDEMPASGSSRTSCFTSRPSSRWRCAITSGFRRRPMTSNCASSKPTARVRCSRRPSMAGRHCCAFFSLPLVTFKIVAAIHWEALRLWLKGARLVPRANAAPAKAAFNTSLAIDRRADYNRTQNHLTP